jgi:hypothetical protein
MEKDKLGRIAWDIIGASDGAYKTEYTGDYYELTPEEQDTVDRLVEEEIAPCDCCGWVFRIDDMEPHHTFEYELVCWKCARDLDEEDEDEEDE